MNFLQEMVMHGLVDLAQENGNGSDFLSQSGEIISTHTHNGVTIERIRLPQGIFRRVTRNGRVVSFTNLSESKKQIR